MQPLLFHLRIFCQNLTHVRYNILYQRRMTQVPLEVMGQTWTRLHFKKKVKQKLLLTLILLTSKWLIARWVLTRQWVFWLRFLTIFTVNLWFGMWIASRSSPLMMVGDHQPTCWKNMHHYKEKTGKLIVRAYFILNVWLTHRFLKSLKC